MPILGTGGLTMSRPSQFDHCLCTNLQGEHLSKCNDINIIVGTFFLFNAYLSPWPFSSLLSESDIDVVKPSIQPQPVYDPVKARYCMDECERYVASARLGEDKESPETDWEEKVSRYVCHLL